MKKENSAGKAPKILKIIKIIVILGWISFLAYDLYLIRYLGLECNSNPANCVFLEERPAVDIQEYKSEYFKTNYGDPAWMQEASLRKDCRPLAFFNDFFFQKIKPFLYFSGLLILLTLINRIDPDEWKRLIEKLKKIERSFN